MYAKKSWAGKGPGYSHDVACPECAGKVTLRTDSILPPELKDCCDHMGEEELRARARRFGELSELMRENKELRAGNRILRARLAKYEVKGLKAPLFRSSDCIKTARDAAIADFIIKGREGAVKKCKQYAFGMPRQLFSNEEVKAVTDYLRTLAAK